MPSSYATFIWSTRVQFHIAFTKWLFLHHTMSHSITISVQKNCFQCLFSFRHKNVCQEIVFTLPKGNEGGEECSCGFDYTIGFSCFSPLTMFYVYFWPLSTAYIDMFPVGATLPSHCYSAVSRDSYENVLACSRKILHLICESVAKKASHSQAMFFWKIKPGGRK